MVILHTYLTTDAKTILKINVFVFLYQNHVNVLFSSHKTKCDTKVGSRNFEPTDFNQY